MVKTQFYPFGASQRFVDQRDEELRAAADGYVDDVPQTEVLPSVVNSPAYKALLHTIEQLRQQVTELAEENRQLRGQRSAKRTSDKPRKSVQRFHSPDEITIDGVRYVSAEWITRTTGLNQSNVSRKLTKLEITPDRVEGNKYFYRKSKLPDIKKKSPRR